MLFIRSALASVKAPIYRVSLLAGSLNPLTSTRLTFNSFKRASKSIGVFSSNAILYEYCGFALSGKINFFPLI
ncbi:hypothetical protein D3C84_924790 [compost metagenome]